ncbi:MAG: hypothetical protein UR85_C0010G0018 [Candidatus Nomurabacteria bacterium GW2011_GWF2_35_66]|uniref:Uncharacterized protein n=1 Tax=Candidatus Nomurabacteria bacterium GW2011_GWE1_35_16 TaxID=1618761 RepID=A0A0G0B954_9BACT|nr:MAG: hypothetical protein UR55_C0016G0014 [Candidatus Nomurabacteria bacterium GW2011_GWF1_34_20]KKP61620.1 MAG: hypothetical protein UR57_C0015G0016 [Candidatus Nomurabacteria bacterium GW2011_GWE2_34_25]KKP65914.1 MAG: hypothetical protein UR64_C0016G0014 [Candidatus Nomurabacteria bacterium GW2011_GWE1_35_16]KKP82970.1 MAG: hypothetical protein UR85_C0010G0018 [Candidatus Nomurabacteria bacterium GW2011_GWF2_35_66]HAE36283.1 hypothetical protein [Candidatus Nomurabacteria bacterium]
MEQILLSLPEISAFMIQIVPFFPQGYDNIDEIVGKALFLDKVPENEVLKVNSTAGNLADAIDEYWGAEKGDEEKASIRQSIRWVSDAEELRGVYHEMMVGISPESFEFSLFIRKAATVLLR